MKKLAQVVDVENEGLVSMLGERVFLMCTTYFYSGNLVGVNDSFVKLDDCHLVYSTGEWSAKAWADAQRIGDGHYVILGAVESFRLDTR